MKNSDLTKKVKKSAFFIKKAVDTHPINTYIPPHTRQTTETQR